ncbi:MAG: hypothetical protein MSC31_08705 [Solirubrobacteraceae bacterium MAG38_C4-C5]|nr:hypothetical protein [Candidatus Siliceabacter maunaloa]
MQRILRRRSDPHEQADEQPTHAFEQPTTQLAVDLPEEKAAPPPSAASFRDRGRLRRRLRYLRRARELGFRDLGGLIFDLRRFARDRPDLVQAKLDALAGVDRELRTLEIALHQRTPIHELHEPGIASCSRCDALHATDDRFCPACGIGLRGPRAVGGPGHGGVQHSVGEIGTVGAGGADGEAAPATDPQSAEGEHAAEGARIPQGERAAQGESVPESEPGAEGDRPEAPSDERPAERWPGSSS